MSTDPRARAWMEIEESAIERNFEALRRRVGPDSGVLPVVKSNAYGVGVEGVVRVLERLDPWGYGVGTVDEGAELRAMGIERPIVVLAPLTSGGESVAVAEALTLAVSAIAEVERLLAEARRQDARASIHVEIDTGIGRAGFPSDRVGSWGPPLYELTGSAVRWDGVFTHLHSADKPGGPGIAQQVEAFDRALRALREQAPRSSNRWIEHICNSAGVVRTPEFSRDLVRPGLYLYGGRPGADLDGPAPVVSLRGRVTRVEDVPPGASLGYGGTHRAERPERWATVGLGYADGLPRPLENRGAALVAGDRVPIVGRISMGLTVVDITDLAEGRVDVGAAVTFLGTDGEEEITLDDVAGQSGRSPYEVLTGLSPSLPRIWT